MAIKWNQALCRHVQDKDRFHVDQWRGEGREWARHTTREAKKICNEPCPILDECREYAIERPVLEGVYGGMSTDERKKERKRRKEAMT